MERINRGFSSLAGCYALLATLACSFLIYAHVAFKAHPPQWADQVGNFVTRSSSGHAVQLAKAFSATRVAALYFLERMHTTRLYYGVFAAVWIACLVWMMITRRRLALRRGALWIVGITLLVLSAAALYGLGTRGVYTHRIPPLAHLSDPSAGAFLLALPLITWSRARSRSDDEEDLDAESDSSSDVSDRLARLGSMSVVPRTEAASPLQLKPEVQLKPAVLSNAPVSADQPPTVDDHTSIAANRLIARMTAPALDCQLPINTTPTATDLKPVAFTPPEPEAATLTESVAIDSVSSLALTRLQLLMATVPPSILEQPAAVMPEPGAIASTEQLDVTPPEPATTVAEPSFALEAPEPFAEAHPEYAAVEIPEPIPAIPAQPLAPIAVDLVPPEPAEPVGATAFVASAPISAALEEQTAATDAEPIVSHISEPVSGVAMHLAAVVFPKSILAPPPAPYAFEPAAFEAAEPVPLTPQPPYSSQPTQPSPTPSTKGHTASADNPELPNGTDAFRHDLLGLYKSWQRIETMQGEIDDWFDRRRRQAITHVATPPAMRTSGLGRNLVRDFPTEKMTAIESEWAEIRNLAIEISRSVGEIPDLNHID